MEEVDALTWFLAACMLNLVLWKYGLLFTLDGLNILRYFLFADELTFSMLSRSTRFPESWIICGISRWFLFDLATAAGT